jgi:antitoxin HicB
MSFDYPVCVTPDDKDGGFVVTCRDLPEVITQGETLADALAQAVDALDESFALRMDDGLEIPFPSLALPGEHIISPPG